MITNNRITGYCGIMIITVILLMTFGCQITFAYGCWSCGEEARKAIQELIRLTKVDSYNNITTYLHTTEEVELLLNALDHESSHVRLVSLDILIDLFRQSNISQQMTSNLVLQSLQHFVQFCPEKDTILIKTILPRGRIALWCAEQYILSEEDKNTALISVVEGPDDNRMRIALDMLSNCNGNCENVIEDLLRAKEKKENMGLKEAASRIQYCITEIRIKESLLTMDNTQKNAYLNELFNEYVLKKPGWGNHEFVLWLITRLKLIGDDGSILSLKRIWKNEILDSAYASNYRSAAQEALIYLKAINPEDRTIRRM